MRKIILSGFLFLLSICSYGQEEKMWSIEAGFGEVQMLENRYDGGGNNYVMNEDQGNAFFVSADYWLTQRLTLTGGVTIEQQGLYTDYSDDIGLKKINMAGLHAGAKYYFFPHKWIFQPYIGASLLTNVLNLGHQRGESIVVTTQGHPDCHATLAYEVTCPALSIVPQIGFDIHLLSSLSLCLKYDLRFGLWGSSKATLRYTDGPVTGQVCGIDKRNYRKGISIGLKMDFPVKPVSGKARNNLLWLLYSWFSSKAY